MASPGTEDTHQFSAAKPCPSCGHCPTCGRHAAPPNYSSWWFRPRWQYVPQPYAPTYPTITWGTTTGQFPNGTSGLGTLTSSTFTDNSGFTVG